MRVISKGHLRRATTTEAARIATTVRTQAATIEPAKVPLSDLEGVASIGLVEAGLAIWTAKPRIAGVVDKRANASRIFNAAEAIASAAEDSAVVALAAADSEADDEKIMLGILYFVFYKAKRSNQLKERT